MKEIRYIEGVLEKVSLNIPPVTVTDIECAFYSHDIILEETNIKHKTNPEKSYWFVAFGESEDLIIKVCFINKSDCWLVKTAFPAEENEINRYLLGGGKIE